MVKKEKNRNIGGNEGENRRIKVEKRGEKHSNMLETKIFSISKFYLSNFFNFESFSLRIYFILCPKKPDQSEPLQSSSPQVLVESSHG